MAAYFLEPEKIGGKEFAERKNNGIYSGFVSGAHGGGLPGRDDFSWLGTFRIGSLGQGIIIGGQFDRDVHPGTRHERPFVHASGR